MKVERVRNWSWSLGKFDSIVLMVILSISLLLFFRLPEFKHFRGIYFNETFQYALIAIVGIILLAVLRPPTLAYFGFPRLKGSALLAIAIASGYAALAITGGYNIQQPLRFKIAGVVYLLAIGFSEELIDRVLIFGFLRRFGLRFAVITSSIIFGLTHLNVYLPNWDLSEAIYHVMSATGFGLLACGIFLATRSFWVVGIFHALADWSVVFEGKVSTTGEDYSPSIAESLRWGAEAFFLEYGLMGLILLYVVRGKWPRWLIRLAIRWKLVEQAEALTSSNSRSWLFSKLLTRFRR